MDTILFMLTLNLALYERACVHRLLAGCIGYRVRVRVKFLYVVFPVRGCVRVRLIGHWLPRGPRQDA